ncbi:MAG: hypothetical protein ACPLZD_06435 [Candidatus Saccharicenans sp.]|nr:MAG: hypothetical protein C0168_03085 [Candidatus Aminicenantes bacterium]HEK85789.1 hypothetical protein [Candidatus Aminicenantes bacterium]
MTSWKKGVFSLVMVFSLICLASVASFSQPTTPASTTVKEIEGTVKVAVGKYIYVPEAQGLDIILAGEVQGGLENLVGKAVRIKATVLPDRANLIVADSIDLKQGDTYQNVYTRSGEPNYDTYFSQRVRDEYVALNITGINKPEEWEGKTKVKVYGKLEKSVVKEGGTEKEITHIIILDKKGKELARVIVDNLTDYAKFYLAKLRLFDKFWFYLNVKEPVDKKIRVRTKELFHADVVFCGLY